MTILNGLGFSRLIKTIVPGLMILCVVVGYVDFGHRLMDSRRTAPLHNSVLIVDWAADNVSLAIALSVPCSIVLGILSNMVMFGWATDQFIRKPFEHQKPHISAAERELAAQVAQAFAATGVTLPDSADLDLEFLVIGDIDLEKITFLQESYWYYLEFQMNTGLAVGVASPLLVSMSVYSANNAHLPPWIIALLAILEVLLLANLLRFFLSTARINFRKHRVKRLSLLTAAAVRVLGGLSAADSTVPSDVTPEPEIAAVPDLSA